MSKRISRHQVHDLITPPKKRCRWVPISSSNAPVASTPWQTPVTSAAPGLQGDFFAGQQAVTWPLVEEALAHCERLDQFRKALNERSENLEPDVSRFLNVGQRDARVPQFLWSVGRPCGMITRA